MKMVNILRKSLAPITDEAWEAIEDQARLTIKGNLSARAVVDLSGPHGWKMAAVNLGRIEIPAKQPATGVQWGIRDVLPLMEIRVPFRLSLLELDSVSRGASDPDLGALEKAASQAAVFEEKAVYHGFKQAGIEGILSSSTHKPLQLAKNAEGYPAAIEHAMVTIEKEGIGGPFDLVLGTRPFEILMAGQERVYPIRRRIEGLIRGEIRWSPALDGGMVISRRGGDYEFTLGQDFSIGYYDHDKSTVSLYLTESFTFRVIEPKAAIELRFKA
jgi:uncharacterized linocin/CFP29 family protein